jgi:hypothetical protein
MCLILRLVNSSTKVLSNTVFVNVAEATADIFSDALFLAGEMVQRHCGSEGGNFSRWVEAGLSGS